MPEENIEERPRPEQIAAECIDSQGYVLFAGIYGPVNPKDGTRVINFRYIRHNFSYEDTAKGIQALREHFRQDIEGQAI